MKYYEICRTNKTITRGTPTIATKVGDRFGIDTATYCKIEKGERRVTAIVEDEHKVADKVLNIAEKNINK
ncbi:hypothetical protein AGMMS49965_13640 [Bacteroidia bacterium]|nr:hypothetical protein AGMMS49965_13640 [Bacteroidia bacterium]